MSNKLKIDGRAYDSVEAEMLAVALCLTKTYLRPKAARDDARQAGTRKKRRPDINDWISDQLRRDPKAKSPALWAKAPAWITDQIGDRRFAARVTDVRKMTRK